MDDLNNKKNYYFISPHLDDAILSAGALIYELKERGRVKIITVFTKGDKSFLKRKVEDKNVCRFLKVGYLHLDFTDVMWRKRTVIKKEEKLKKEITDKLMKIINDKRGVVFAPLSIGDHADHKMVSEICRDNFTDVIYWEDYPYNLKSKIAPPFIKRNNLSFFEYKKNLFIKEKLIRFYDSQIKNLFADKPIILKKEKFYYFL